MWKRGHHLVFFLRLCVIFLVLNARHGINNDAFNSLKEEKQIIWITTTYCLWEQGKKNRQCRVLVFNFLSVISMLVLLCKLVQVSFETVATQPAASMQAHCSTPNQGPGSGRRRNREQLLMLKESSLWLGIDHHSGVIGTNANNREMMDTDWRCLSPAWRN